MAQAFETEWEARRLFLWAPVLAGAGVFIYFASEYEPALWGALFATIGAGAGAYLLRAHRLAFVALSAVAALCFGFCCAKARMMRVDAPVLDNVRIADLTGFVEEIDPREEGARILLRLVSFDGLSDKEMPYRVRVSSRRDLAVSAGDFVALKARLLPPSGATLPGGYEFSRDAYFSRIGAVGSLFGQIEVIEPPEPLGLIAGFGATLDRFRNRLGERIASVIQGDEGAIAVAMVTGKRDRLSSGTKELIREAGIFHIITISGLQMTLVAGILFWILRRLLSLSPRLALNYPIKKWAAVGALFGALLYDMATGSRVGTERALIMTMIVFLAVLVDREALSLRNLALAALVVIVLEPEALLGASFQLSFAAVGALIGAYEFKFRARSKGKTESEGLVRSGSKRNLGTTLSVFDAFGRWFKSVPVSMLTATACASAATASFMAYNFHEISPYVMIGNPLTMTMIEIVAVPGALLGALLYPFGLDQMVWYGVGLGIDIVLRVARLIAAAPGASMNVPAFAPWAAVFLTLAVLCAILWRSALLKAFSLPFLAIGLMGATQSIHHDLLIAPSGDMLAYRGEDGTLQFVGKKLNPFVLEQWLRADGDSRSVDDVVQQSKENCDAYGCIGRLKNGQIISLVLKPNAFEEDCERADFIVTGLFAPNFCQPRQNLFDRKTLKSTGALALNLTSSGPAPSWSKTAQLTAGDERPWRSAPKQNARSLWIKTRPSRNDSETAETGIPVSPFQ